MSVDQTRFFQIQVLLNLFGAVEHIVLFVNVGDALMLMDQRFVLRFDMTKTETNKNYVVQSSILHCFLMTTEYICSADH